MIKVFISYTTADEAFADKLAMDLNAYASSIFYAKWHIKVGDSIVDKINLGLEKHDYIVVILSNSSIQSVWVKRELNSSLMRQLRDKTIKILPVLKDDCSVPPLFSDIMYADFRVDYNKGLSSLLCAFEEDFSLEPYIGLIESTSFTESIPYDSKTLAILLKRLMPIRFGCMETLSRIEKFGSVEHYNFNNDNLADLQIQMFIDENLLEMANTDGVNRIIFTGLGKIVYELISAAGNEGILDIACSS